MPCSPCGICFGSCLWWGCRGLNFGLGLGGLLGLGLGGLLSLGLGDHLGGDQWGHRCLVGDQEGCQG